VKLAFILDRIAAQGSITVTQDELVARLWQLAQRWKKDPAEVRKIFDAQGLWPSVVSTIRQENTIAFLLSAAAVTPSTSGTHQQGGSA
jgi:FKBP-type peptidyl-prolyl cis-trans isomerase (trigger factor)